MRLVPPIFEIDSRARSRAERPTPQLVRCACTLCGAHMNALKTFRVTGSCANCGSFELEVIEGAAPVGGPLAA